MKTSFKMVAMLLGIFLVDFPRLDQLLDNRALSP